MNACCFYDGTVRATCHTPDQCGLLRQTVDLVVTIRPFSLSNTSSTDLVGRDVAHAVRMVLVAHYAIAIQHRQGRHPAELEQVDLLAVANGEA